VKFADQQKVLSRQKRQLWRIPQQQFGGQKPFMQQQQPSQSHQDFEDLSHFNDQRYAYHFFKGAIPILRQHIFGLFLTYPPTKYRLNVSKIGHFLYPLNPRPFSDVI
jgi:hypothetical protein